MPRVRCKRRGALFFALVRKEGPTTEAERDASQHAVDGIAWVFFFSFIHQIKFFFTFCVSTTGLNTTGPIFFSFWKRPGGRLLPYFCSEKRPGYVANAPGALFRNCLMERPAPGGVYLVLYGIIADDMYVCIELVCTANTYL